MLKFSSKLPLIGLALGGIVASSLPWTGVYRGSLPPGNLPNTIFYGFQVNGLYCAISFIGIILVCLFTSVKRAMTNVVALINILLAGLVLLLCAKDIIPIAFQGDIVGTVPFLREGPLVTGGIALISLILSLSRALKNRGG